MQRITIGDLTLYPERRRVETKGKKIKIGYMGWELIKVLGGSPGNLVSRDFLMASVYPDPEDRPCARAIDMLVCHVRKRIAQALGGDNYIHAVNSHGYVLRPPR